ncbi:hypothetical protein SAMN04488137_3877 [Fictibacillus solisalsi]|uniref:Uncharacterized protein n=1 Tax=Fictibacillus solisalsi TaxID=459525 RepID=A0A1H0A1A0_9BACL|nr:hypothetical protein SAMN04488137_3877 [Fictibacillus solisalsi]
MLNGSDDSVPLYLRTLLVFLFHARFRQEGKLGDELIYQVTHFW